MEKRSPIRRIMAIRGMGQVVTVTIGLIILCLVFGLGGCMFIYVLGPLLNNLYAKVPARVKNRLCAVLLAVFLVDFAYSSFVPNTGEGITDYPAPSLPPAQE